jgi:hypothetical protein
MKKVATFLWLTFICFQIVGLPYSRVGAEARATGARATGAGATGAVAASKFSGSRSRIKMMRLHNTD